MAGQLRGTAAIQHSEASQHQGQVNHCQAQLQPLGLIGVVCGWFEVSLVWAMSIRDESRGCRVH